MAANNKVIKRKKLIDVSAAKNPAQRAAAQRILKAREMELIKREEQVIRKFGGDAYRDNLYEPDIVKERDRRRAKEEASIRKTVERRRVKVKKNIVTAQDIKNRKDAVKKAQSLTPYKKVIRSKKTQRAVVARLEAKREGQAAAVRIAKARISKKKKAPYTAEAREKNRRMQVENKIALTQYKSGYTNETIKAAKKEASLMIETGAAKRDSRTIRSQAIKLLEAGKMPHLSGFKIPPERVDLAERRVKEFRKDSKTAARISGGYATSMKRNAEAGIGHIARGRALKNVARAGGALSLVSMFLNHINTKEKNNG